ncbi:unnamed protein product [Trifolium pratense]|uniref:Uncharacterized protein n=1 Tax=Trifolium pratense TaxID=57577 RepID=A0ACB0KQI5_TRIPR|nr:unnamed protein product [Trifolium pratense]
MNDSRRKCNGGEISWRRDCLTDMAVRFHCRKKDGGATAAAIKYNQNIKYKRKACMNIYQSRRFPQKEESFNILLNGNAKEMSIAIAIKIEIKKLLNGDYGVIWKSFKASCLHEVVDALSQ